MKKSTASKRKSTGAVRKSPRQTTRSSSDLETFTYDTPSIVPGDAVLAEVEEYHDFAVVLDAGRFKNDDEMAALHAWFDERESELSDRPIVIHLHGGLVSEKSGLSSAHNVVDKIYRPADAHPLCVVWKTGPGDVIRTGIGDLVRESLFNRLVEKVAGALKDKVTGGLAAATNEVEAIPEQPSASTGRNYEGVLEFSGAELEAFEQSVAQDADIMAELDAIASEDLGAVVAGSGVGGPPRLSRRTFMDAVVVLEVHQDLRGGGARPAGFGLRFAARVAKVLLNVGRRYMTKRDHGFHATVVEEIARALYLDKVGRWAWDEMKEYVEHAFDPEPRAGGAAIVERLCSMLAKGIRRRVVLVGHSAGTIFVCKLLQQAHGALSRINTAEAANFSFDVIFLAPAVRYDVFEETIRIAGPRISGFRMFLMRDEHERDDTLIDQAALSWLYPSSLLYLVSGICEGEADVPLVGMERFHRFTSPFSAAKFPEVQRVRDWLSRRPNRMVLSPTVAEAPEGLRSGARDHGHFDDEDPQTMESVKTIVAATLGLTEGTLSAVDLPTSLPFDGFPAGATGDSERGLHPALFTGRTLLRMPRTLRGELSRTMKRTMGVSLEFADTSGDVAQILDATAAAQLPGTEIAVANLAPDQISLLTRGHSLLASLASGPSPVVLAANERWAYLAADVGGEIDAFLDGYEVATRNLLSSLKSHRSGVATAPSPTTTAPPSVAITGSRISGALEQIRVDPTSRQLGAGVRLCVIDTGIDKYHPDIVRSFGSGRRALVSKSFVDGESPHDHHGHGTHCAGLAIGPIETALGYRYGVASGADLYVAKVFNTHNRASESDVILALTWAQSMKCSVASMSLVFRVVSPENDQLFDEVVAGVTNEGLLVVAACGNDTDRRRGRRVGVYHPAACAPSVAVAAVDENGVPANFSNGGVQSGARNPDISAPGVEITSSVSGPRQYSAMSGTSMATPLVAGVAALHVGRSAAIGQPLRGADLRRALLSTNSVLNFPVQDVGVGLVRAP